MEITLVWAEARGGAIGRGGTMPWHLPEDLAHFKQETLGTSVVMGRRTWESLPERFRPLPGRPNIVVTRDPAYVAPGAVVTDSLEQAFALAAGQDDGDAVSVIGGGEIYRAALPLATELVVTRIDVDVPDADTFAPNIGDEWQLVDADESLVSETGLGYRFERYRRRGSVEAHAAAEGRIP